MKYRKPVITTIALPGTDDFYIYDIDVVVKLPRWAAIIEKLLNIFRRWPAVAGVVGITANGNKLFISEMMIKTTNIYHAARESSFPPPILVKRGASIVTTFQSIRRLPIGARVSYSGFKKERENEPT